MMLPGRLRLTTLGDVLGTLSREGASGVLEITEQAGSPGGRVHRIRIVGGRVGSVESRGVGPRLGELLRAGGRLSASELTRLIQHILVFPNKRAGEILVDEGIVDSRDVSSALREQSRTRLEHLYQLRDGRLAFRVAIPDRSVPTALFEPEEFLHGRPRARSAPESGLWTRPAGEVAEHAGNHRRDPVRSHALSALGLDPGADRDSVQRAFRMLAARFHPDRHPGATDTERAALMRRFAEITAAYHALVA